MELLWLVLGMIIGALICICGAGNILSNGNILSTALHNIRDTTIDPDSMGIAEEALRKVGEIK